MKTLVILIICLMCSVTCCISNTQQGSSASSPNWLTLSMDAQKKIVNNYVDALDEFVQVMPKFGQVFVKCLNDYKVTHALYLDMGRGWNYAWYRDKTGKVVELFPESKMAPSYKYRTNWLTFYK